jgi:hypothetical protein
LKLNTVSFGPLSGRAHRSVRHHTAQSTAPTAWASLASDLAPASALPGQTSALPGQTSATARDDGVYVLRCPLFCFCPDG